MTPLLIVIVVVLAGLAGSVVLLLLKHRRGGTEQAEVIAEVTRLASLARDGQASLEGRLQTMNESADAARSAMTQRLHEQELKLNRTLEHGLQSGTNKTLETMGRLEKRLAVIDKAQDNITQLSNQMVGLQDILSNKQARGAFGEIQLNDLVQQILPPSAYKFQAQLSNGRRADCLLDLPHPPGPIVIDAKFPLESYNALRNATDDAGRLAATRGFRDSIKKHVNDIAARYILPGETAEAALMFVPSEAVYAELHANVREAVEASYKARVFIVSPTTLWATLNTVRAVLKDVQMREQAGVIQKEVGALLTDVGRLDKRVGKLQQHFDQGAEDIRQIRISTEKVTKRAERIETVELEEPVQPTDGLDGPRASGASSAASAPDIPLLADPPARDD